MNFKKEKVKNYIGEDLFFFYILREFFIVFYVYRLVNGIMKLYNLMEIFNDVSCRLDGGVF